MPCILKIRVIGARDLPVMDKATELTDAYVEVKFADYEIQRTQICRKTLNPVWNSDFRIEVSNDADLQNEPVELRVLDYDTISANDVVGLVSIDINSLLAWEASSTIDDSILNYNSSNERQISGWFPLYDSLCGIRGEVNVQIKLQFFGDVNPFKDSSAGVCFFTSPSIPDCYQVEEIFGLVEVLLNENDPEFSWADTFRAPRTSNESRQKLLYRLSGQLRRLLGREVLEMNGNAVIGFKLYFDSETEGGILTGRAIGTCAKLRAQEESPVTSTQLDSPELPETGVLSLLNLNSEENSFRNNSEIDLNNSARNPSMVHANSSVLKQGESMEKQTKRYKKVTSVVSIPKSEQIFDASVPPMSAVQPSSPDIDSISGKSETNRHWRSDSSKDLFEAPVDPVILTIHSFPPNVITNIGGLVSAKSVKLYQGNDTELRKTRWWELREEVTSISFSFLLFKIMGHAKTLGCQYVMGYSETATFRDELCVLAAMGTAVNVDLDQLKEGIPSLNLPPTVQENDEIFRNDPDLRLQDYERSDSDLSPEPVGLGLASGKQTDDSCPLSPRRGKSARLLTCKACHIPYSEKNTPFPMTVTKCLMCEKASVPEMLFSTTEIPSELDIIGHPQLLEAHVCRSKKKKEGESNAAIVSDSLPFIEYDLHRQLMYKLRMLGMNALFGCQFHLTIGEGWMVATASGSAIYLAALPPPPLLRFNRNFDIVVDPQEQRIVDAQRKIVARSEINQKIVEAKHTEFMEKMMKTERKTPIIADETSDIAKNPDNDSDGESLSDSGNVKHWRILPKKPVEDPVQPKISIVVQVDDDADEDLLAVLVDPIFAEGFKMHNLCEMCPVENLKLIIPNTIDTETKTKTKYCTQMVTVIKEANLSSTSHPNLFLSTLFHELYNSIRWVSNLNNSILNAVSINIDMPKEGIIHLRANGMLTGTYTVEIDESNDSSAPILQEQESEHAFSPPETPYPLDIETIGRQKTQESQMQSILAATLSSSSHPFIEITPLPRVPQCKTISYLGRLSLHFVKEDLNLHHVYGNHYTDQNHQPENAIDDDLGRFVHTFMLDIQAVVRAHTIAMGGNAVVSYRIENSEFRETVRNQAYGMVSIGGDVVCVEPLEGRQVATWSEMINDLWEVSRRCLNMGR